MQSKYSSPTVSNSNSFTQPSALSGFKFSTIGHNPSLLERMSDGPRVSFPPSDQNLSQEQNTASLTPFRPTLPQPLTMGAPPVERGPSVKPIITQDPKSLPPASASLTPFEPPNDVKLSQPLDQIRPSVFPDLQYPNATPDIESPLWESPTAPSQPVPMDQDASHHHRPPIPRTLPPVTVSNAPGVQSVLRGETADTPTPSLPSTSSEHNGAATSST